jgi:hypothetical protein
VLAIGVSRHTAIDAETRERVEVLPDRAADIRDSADGVCRSA